MKFSTMACVLALSITAVATSAAPQKAKKSSKSGTKVVPAAAAATAAAVALTPEQQALAQYVSTGRFPCADGKTLTVTADDKVNGAFDVRLGGEKYDVVPVPSKSGALRLEDSRTGFVMMQLANKSMLFNERQGRRLADDCISPAQQAFADNMKANPTAGVLDAAK